MHKFLCTILISVLLSVPLTISSHPGRTDKYGGHTESATGQYHIHNEDGTITYTTKPTEPKQQTQQPAVQQSTPEPAPAPASQPQNNTPQPSASENAPVAQTPEQPQQPVVPSNEVTAPPVETESANTNIQSAPPPQTETPPVVTINETTATVGESTKPLQTEVTENISLQSGDTVQSDNTVATSTTIYKYTSQDTNRISISLLLAILLIFFATIGVCMISSVVHLALKKLEGKSQNIDFLLYLPFIIVIIPAHIGDLLFKAYIKLKDKAPPNPKQQSKRKDNFM